MSRLNDWLQVLTSVGVLIGLLLVALEIRETNEIAKDEALTEFWSNWIDLSTPDYSTGIGALYVKAIDDPKNLTDEEMFQLSSWLTAAMSTYGQLFLMYNTGRITDDYSSELAADVEYYFGNGFGRAWYTENKNWLLPQMRTIIEEEMANNPDMDSGARFDRMREQL